MSQVAGRCGSRVSFIVTVGVGCCVKGYRVQRERALEFESWGLADSGAKLRMVFHIMVKSPNVSGMAVKQGAGGGVEAGYSFSGKDCPKEREGNWPRANMHMEGVQISLQEAGCGTDEMAWLLRGSPVQD